MLPEGITQKHTVNEYVTVWCFKFPLVYINSLIKSIPTTFQLLNSNSRRKNYEIFRKSN